MALDAFYFIDQFKTDKQSGIVRIAKATGLNRTTVWLWTQPKEKRGTGGKIPSSAEDLVLEAARLNRIRLNQAKMHVKA